MRERLALQRIHLPSRARPAYPPLEVGGGLTGDGYLTDGRPRCSVTRIHNVVGRNPSGNTCARVLSRRGPEPPRAGDLRRADRVEPVARRRRLKLRLEHEGLDGDVGLQVVAAQEGTDLAAGQLLDQDH